MCQTSNRRNFQMSASIHCNRSLKGMAGMHEYIARSLCWHQYTGGSEGSGHWPMDYGRRRTGRLFGIQMSPSSVFLGWMGKSGAGGGLGRSWEAATSRRQWSMVEGVWWFGGASHLMVSAVCTASMGSWMQEDTSAFWTILSWVSYATIVLGLSQFISSKITTQSTHWSLPRLGSPLITLMSLLGHLINPTWTSLRIYGVTLIMWCMRGIHHHTIMMNYGRYYRRNGWGLTWTILHVLYGSILDQVDARLTTNCMSVYCSYWMFNWHFWP